MKIIVLSDIHNDKEMLRKIVSNHRNSAGLFVFLGDGIDDFEDETMFDSRIKTVSVKGNWDYDSNHSVYEVFKNSGKTFFITHGDLYNVDGGIEIIAKTALEKGADICLHGHTHKAAHNKIGNFHVINPGAVTGRGEYCILDVTPEDIKVTFMSVLS